MKKVLNLAFAIIGLLLLAFLVALEVNSIHPFITLPAEHLNTINLVVEYGAMAVLGAWVLVFFMGKNPLRILLSVVAILVIAAGVIAFGFPNLITSILG